MLRSVRLIFCTRPFFESTSPCRTNAAQCNVMNAHVRKNTVVYTPNVILLLGCFPSRLSLFPSSSSPCAKPDAHEARRDTTRRVRALADVGADELAPAVLAALELLDLLVRVGVAEGEASGGVAEFGGVGGNGAELGVFGGFVRLGEFSPEQDLCLDIFVLDGYFVEVGENKVVAGGVFDLRWQRVL